MLRLETKMGTEYVILQDVHDSRYGIVSLLRQLMARFLLSIQVALDQTLEWYLPRCCGRNPEGTHLHFSWKMLIRVG